jgi:hypothetical protein
MTTKNNRISANKTMPKKTPQSPLSSSGIVADEFQQEEKITKVEDLPTPNGGDSLVLETDKINNEPKEEVEDIEPKAVKPKQQLKEKEKPQENKDEVAIEHVKAEIVEEKKEDNLFDLFSMKKKEKIRKIQKNLTLKESNVEFLENLAHETGRDQNEIVDTLLENLAKMMDMKK